MATKTVTANNTSKAVDPAVDQTVASIETVDRSEINRIVARIKHELGQLHADANRKRALFSPTTKEAQAKLSAALTVLDEFATQLDSIKSR